jgi:hypothetical protein
MAQTDAMETAKEVLRQIIKYRFWISVGVAALFAVIAYAVGSGPIREKAATETTAILGAESEVKNYSSLSIPTKEHKPIVEEKTAIVSKDVTTAWRTLYERQAPLLTWPEGVQERFQSWGRTWPEKVKPQKIELAIVDYIEAYPAYVTMVYKSFDPFDYETGEGVVAAPSEAELLLPAQFSQERLPDLGKVWAAQERLWIQRTVLEVVAEVNKNAKKWDEAIIRQIISLDVGNPDAQDQYSLAKNLPLEESKGIYPPGEEPPADDAATGSSGSVSMPGGQGGKLSGMGGGRRGGGDIMGGMGGGMGAGMALESVFYVKSDSPDKYKVLPLVVTVLINQDRVQDFLIELENSPMSIQVKDFELVRPSSRVAKPEKGEAGSSLAMMSGMMGGRMGMGGGLSGMVGMGGMANQMEQHMQTQMQTQRMMSGGMTQMMYGPGGGGAAPQAKKSGKSVRDTDRKKQRETKTKEIDAAKGPSTFDPFFDIVQVKVYGQARFFNAPPADAPAEPSSGATVAGAAAAAPAGTTPKSEGAETPAAEAAGKGGAPKAAADSVAPDAKSANPAGKAAAPDAKSNPAKAKSTDAESDEDKPADAKKSEEGATDPAAKPAKAKSAEDDADAQEDAPATKKTGPPKSKGSEANRN